MTADNQFDRPRNILEGLNRNNRNAGVTLGDLNGRSQYDQTLGVVVNEDTSKGMRERRLEWNNSHKSTPVDQTTELGKLFSPIQKT